MYVDSFSLKLSDLEDQSEYTLKNIPNFRIIYFEKRCLWTQMDRSILEAANLETAKKEYVAEDTAIKDCLPG
jgi:hypothetical protein